MNEDQNSAKGIAKGAIKSFGKKLLVPATIVTVIIFMLLSSTYTVFKDDFKKVSKKNSNYETSINANGQIVYTTTAEDGSGEKLEVTPLEMAQDFKEELGKYIDGDDEEYNEKVKYLIGAEAVTKMPYIDGTPADELVGQIKFYRYRNKDQADKAYEEDISGEETEELVDGTEELVEEPEELVEEYRLTYKNQEEFKKLKENYENGRDDSGIVFKHFTIDDDGNVIIIYASKEVRTVTSNDNELSLSKVNSLSTETYGEEKGIYSATKLQTFEGKIDYLSLVEQYVMPSNLLYALLVQTRDIKFVEAIAGLAYDNEIAIGIYDNNSHSETSETYTYNKILKADGTTSLILSGVSIEDPAINPSTLTKDQYDFVKECQAHIKNEQLEHQTTDNQGNSEKETTTINTYIKSENKDGQIKSLGTADTALAFKTVFTKTIDANSTPTVGVMIADTWIAKWKATYEKEEPDDINDGSSKDSKDEFTLFEYKDTAEFINAFDSSMEVSKDLEEHASKLKSAAVKNIKDETEFKVPVDTINSVYEISETKRRQIFMALVKPSAEGGCDECATECEKVYKLNKVQMWEELDSSGSTNSHEGAHYQQNLQSYMKKQNDIIYSNADKKKELKRGEVEKLLKTQITTEQKFTGIKKGVNMHIDTSMKRSSYMYKKTDTVETSDEGKKFSDTFNNDDFYESKQAMLARTEWFWEYVRDNEDTAKLENMLRYLLNIATDSNNFGTFTKEDLVNLFRAFEPRVLSAKKSVGHFEAFIELVKSYESDPLREYMSGSAYYSYEDVQQYIVEKEGVIYGKIYQSKNGDYCYPYGIKIADRNGNPNDDESIKGAFPSEIQNKWSTLIQERNSEETYIEMTKLDEILKNILQSKCDFIKKEVEDIKKVKAINVNMEANHYYALTYLEFKEENVGAKLQEIAQAFKNNNMDNEETKTFEQFKSQVQCFDGFDQAWILFNQGRYILSNGEEIYASTAALVAEYALSYLGCTAYQINSTEGGLFKYKCSTGYKFSAGDWCAMFVSYCFDSNGLINLIGKPYVACNYLKNFNGVNASSEQYGDPRTYTPQPGDVIFYSFKPGYYSHTAIVVECDGTKVYTVEGNMGPQWTTSTVKRDTYNLSDSRIIGYINTNI